MKHIRLLTIAGALLAMLALALLAGACGDDDDGEEADGGTDGGGATTVNITATDGDKYEFVLDKTSVPAGEVTFVLSNEGDLEHELLIYPQQDISPLLEEKVAAVEAGQELSISGRIQGLGGEAAGGDEAQGG